MAKELNIEVKVQGSFLFLNGQAIGIGCNSAYATINEFIAYVFLTVWHKYKSFKMPHVVIDQIKRYWFTDEQMEALGREIDE